MLFTTNYISPIGNISILTNQDALLHLAIAGQSFPNDLVKKGINTNHELEIIRATITWLGAYFDGKKPSASSLAIAPQGSAFRQNVWELLLQIPYGEVRTYGNIAKEIAAKKGIAKMASQAIGGAVGHNPIPIIIPCHRVIGASGNLTGYSDGIDLKIKLLAHEGVDVTKLSMPKRH